MRRHSSHAEAAALRIAELERKHLESIERSMQRFRILNAVGLRVQQELHPDSIYRTVANELRPLNLNVLITSWDESEQALRMDYVSRTAGENCDLEDISGLSQPVFKRGHSSDAGIRLALAQRQAVFSDAPASVFQRIMPTLSADQVQHP